MLEERRVRLALNSLNVLVALCIAWWRKVARYEAKNIAANVRDHFATSFSPPFGTSFLRPMMDSVHSAIIPATTGSSTFRVFLLPESER